MSRAAERAGLLVVVAFGMWPWLGELGRWPMTPDAVTWIERAALGRGWLQWTFLASHFEVGWRPVTALSFTADRLIGGLDPGAYRATDMVLHALTVWLVALSTRRIAPHLPSWSGLLAALVFAAHPVAEEVVPYLARRSYSLAAVLTASALAIYLGPPDRRAPPTLRASLAAGSLLALGVAANEVAVLAGVAVPFLAWARFGRALPPWSRATLVLAAPVVVVVGLRTAVVGGLGGYEAGRATAGEVLRAAWSATGGIGTDWPAVSWVVPALVVPYYAWHALTERGAVLALAGWVSAYPLLYAGQGVWFPRQAYVAVLPFAWLVATVAVATWRSGGAWARAGRLAPQAVMVGLLLSGSPLLRGMDTDLSGERRDCQALIDGALAECARLARHRSGPLTVNLVLPFSTPIERDGVLRAKPLERELTRTARLPARWLELYLLDTEIEPREFLYVYQESGRRDPLAAWSEDGLTLVVRTGCAYYLAETTDASPGSGVDGETRTRLVRQDATAPRKVDAPSGHVWFAEGTAPAPGASAARSRP